MIKILLSLMLAFSLSATAAPTQTKVVKVSNTDVTLTVDNSVILSSVMCEEVVARVSKKAKELDGRLPSGDPIYLVLNTPGGCIDDSLGMIEVLKRLNRPVHTVVLFAASMGFQATQQLGNRYILRDGTLMSHKARGGFSGEFPGQLDSRYGYYLKRILRMEEQVAKRTNGKHTLKSYHNLIENEYWCDGSDCVAQGFADKVITAKCDKSLDGIREETEKFFFAGMKIQIVLNYDKCPLITGLLDYDILIDGQKLFKKKENSWDSDSVALTKEQLTELDTKVQNIIKDKADRKVIRY